MRVLSKEPDKRPDNAEAMIARADARRGERRSSPAACAPRSPDRSAALETALAKPGSVPPPQVRRSARAPLTAASCTQRHAQRARRAVPPGARRWARTPLAAIAVMLAAAHRHHRLREPASRRAPAAAGGRRDEPRRPSTTAVAATPPAPARRRPAASGPDLDHPLASRRPPFRTISNSAPAPRPRRTPPTERGSARPAAARAGRHARPSATAIWSEAALSRSSPRRTLSRRFETLRRNCSKKRESGSLRARMDPSQIDALVQRLVANPHDEEALAYAHQAGAADPEVVRAAPRAGRRRDARPGVRLPLAERGRQRLVDDARRRAPRRARAHAGHRPRPHAAHGRRAARAALSRQGRRQGPRRAARAARQGARAPGPAERRDPRRARRDARGARAPLERQPASSRRRRSRTSAARSSSSRRARYAIYGAREIYKSLGQWDDAIQMYEAELAVEHDPERQLALLRDEAATRRAAGDLAGATRALAARAAGRRAGSRAPAGVRGAHRRAPRSAARTSRRRSARCGAELLVGARRGLRRRARPRVLGGRARRRCRATTARCSSTRTTRSALQREDDVAGRYLAYVEANPNGAMAAEARWLLAASYEGAGQIDNAHPDPRAAARPGDAQATAKLRELYGAARSGRCRRCRLPPPQPATGPRRHGQAHARAAAAQDDAGARAGQPIAGRQAAGRPRRGADARQQGQARRGATRSTARCSRPTRRTPRRSPGSRTTCARSATTRCCATCCSRRVRVAGRVARRAQGAPARGRRALRGQPPRHRRRHQRVEAAARHRPQPTTARASRSRACSRRRSAGTTSPTSRAGGDRRERRREEDRAREEARHAPGAEAQATSPPRPRRGAASPT